MPFQRSDASRFIYLHGFGGGKKSIKANAIDACLSKRDMNVEYPNFNDPDFASLTMTRMLTDLGDIIKSAPSSLTLIGSSLGGALAILAADRFESRVERVILLAPAVKIDNIVDSALPVTYAKGVGSRAERIEEWRRDGSMPFKHFGFDGHPTMHLNFAFYEDSLRN